MARSPSRPVKPSSPQGEPLYLTVGYLRRAHGLRGEILMDVYTEFPERLRPGVIVYLGEEHQPMEIASVRPHRQALLIAFQGIHTPEDAGRWRNTWVYVTAADRPPLPAGQFYVHQVLGLRVVTEQGHLLGTLAEVLETGANKVYVVIAEDGQEILLPAIEQVIREIDLHQGEIRVHLLAGLIPGEDDLET